MVANSIIKFFKSEEHDNERDDTPKFFKGDNLMLKMQQSLFGKFLTILNDLKKFTDIDVQSLIVLPKIIVVGGESAGKSSVLERSAGCPIFPRKIGICTKMPV